MGLDWAKYVCPILLPISFLYDSILYWLTLARYYTRYIVTVQFSTVQNSTVQYSTVQYSKVQYRTV